MLLTGRRPGQTIVATQITLPAHFYASRISSQINPHCGFVLNDIDGTYMSDNITTSALGGQVVEAHSQALVHLQFQQVCC